MVRCFLVVNCLHHNLHVQSCYAPNVGLRWECINDGHEVSVEHHGVQLLLSYPDLTDVGGWMDDYTFSGLLDELGRVRPLPAQSVGFWDQIIIARERDNSPAVQGFLESILTRLRPLWLTQYAEGLGVQENDRTEKQEGITHIVQTLHIGGTVVVLRKRNVCLRVCVCVYVCVCVCVCMCVCVCE